MNNLKGAASSGTPMPKCKKPKQVKNWIPCGYIIPDPDVSKQTKEHKVVFEIKDNGSFDIIAGVEGIEITCVYEDGSYRGSCTSISINKKKALKMANSIIKYYATKHI